MSTNPTPRRRGEAAREEAIQAARALLLESGPQAVTLKAVGAAMGVGHANLIHHFGSAEGLRGALMERVVRDLADRIASGLATGGAPDRQTLLDAVFDAFGEGGAAQMAAWMTLTREDAQAQAFAGVVRDLADRLSRLAGDDPTARERAREVVLGAAYMALADGLIGDRLTGILHAPRDLGRRLALRMTAGL